MCVYGMCRVHVCLYMYVTCPLVMLQKFIFYTQSILSDPQLQKAEGECPATTDCSIRKYFTIVFVLYTRAQTNVVIVVTMQTLLK